MKNILITLVLVGFFSTQVADANTYETQTSYVTVTLPQAGKNFNADILKCLLEKSGVSSKMDISFILKSLKKVNGKWQCSLTFNQMKNFNSISNGSMRLKKSGKIYSFTWETSGTCSVVWEETDND